MGPIDIWEAQEGWVYTGHREWTPEEAGEQEVIQHTEHLQYEPDWVRAWLNKNDSDIGLCNRVREEEYPNRWGGQNSCPLQVGPGQTGAVTTRI